MITILTMMRPNIIIIIFIIGRKLPKVAADLQKKTGERVDFDAAVSFLITRYLEQEKNWEKFDEFYKPLEGLSREELLEELKKGRSEDEKKYSDNYIEGQKNNISKSS
ncbi:MAG: hypothetical protein R6U96_03220 [Promethearchaeia archaeon]